MPGTVTIYDTREYFPRQVWQGKFDNYKDLRKLLFLMKGKQIEVVVKFDERIKTNRGATKQAAGRRQDKRVERYQPKAKGKEA